jgi:essential nuclear protein 1
LKFRSVDPAAAKAGEDLTSLDGFSLAGDSVPARVKLPVIWHKCLLEFARKYKEGISEDQREALLDLLLSHGHAKIAPEIRRELIAGRKAAPRPAEWDGDDTMFGA